ncbi:MAG: ABC transporter ATP-binding protein, partial [Pseudonocardia sp.]|nr:ABC transporter ATP-binding protein [Pseudonocardia sp.]
VSDMLRQVRELADDGLAVLLVEQNVRASLDLADRLYLLERGTVVASGDADQMRGDDRIVAAYLGGLRR